MRSALGPSSNQAQRVFAKAIVSGGVLDKDDIALIGREKRQIIRGSGALDVQEGENIGDVGGLEVLKQWLRLRESAFREEARDYGLPEPKGDLESTPVIDANRLVRAKAIAGRPGLLSRGDEGELAHGRRLGRHLLLGPAAAGFGHSPQGA